MKNVTLTLILTVLSTNLYADCNTFVDKLTQSGMIVSVKTCTSSK